MARDNTDPHSLSSMENISGVEQRVADWYQNSTIGFHILNAQGIIVAINDTELRWTGYRRDEVVGKIYIGDVLTEPSKKKMAQHGARLRSDRKSADVEYEVVRKDGSTFHALVHDFPLHDSNGELTGYHSSSIDITHHKRLEERLRLSETNFARAQALAQVGHYEIHLANSRFPAGGMWSQETYRILGRDPAAGPMNLKEFVEHCVHPDDRTAGAQSVRKSMAADHDTEMEFRVVLPDGAFRHVKAIGRFAPGLGVQPDKLFGVLIDLTDIKLAQEKIGRSERRFRAMIEKTDETIALFSRDGKVLYSSPSASTLMGISAEQLVGKHVWDLIHPDDGPCVANDLAAIFNVPGATVISQFRTPHPSGDWRWVESAETNRLDDPDIGAIIVNVRDITTRKAMEQALTDSNNRLRELSANLEEVREKERADIAQALHDEVGQHYAALQMGIHWLEQRHSGDPASVEKTQLMRQLMTRAFGTIRNIIHSLHPPMLDDLGLVGALEALVEDVTQSSGIAIEFSSNAPCEGLPKLHQLALFRGLQEALTNVSRHAQASQVKVRLQCDAKAVNLQIEDNGGGMTAAAREKRGSFGLFGMSERIKALGGSFDVRSELGAGTTICLSVPIRDRRQLERK